MKTLISFAFFILICICSQSCSDQASAGQATETAAVKNSEKFKFEIKPLKERSAELSALPEWEKINERSQNLYQKVRLTGDPVSVLELAAIYTQEARITGDHPYYYNAASDIIDIVLNNPPKEKNLQYQALVSKASIKLSQHKFSEALSLGEKALKLGVIDAQVYGVLCDANVELGNYEVAVAMADKMNSIKPDLRSYARVSYLRELHGEFDGAVSAMKMAIAAGVPGHENTAWARVTLANMYMDYGKISEAQQELNVCLRERPDFPFALAAQADILVHQNKLEEASIKIEKALKIIPEFSFVLTQIDIANKKGDREFVEQSKKELLVMLKEDTESGHNMNSEMASLYLDLFDDTDKAKEYLSAEISERNQNIELNKLAAKIYCQEKNWKAMEESIAKARVTSWQDPEMLMLDAISKFKNGNKKAAAQSWDKALKFKHAMVDSKLKALGEEIMSI